MKLPLCILLNKKGQTQINRVRPSPVQYRLLVLQCQPKTSLLVIPATAGIQKPASLTKALQAHQESPERSTLDCDGRPLRERLRPAPQAGSSLSALSCTPLADARQARAPSRRDSRRTSRAPAQEAANALAPVPDFHPDSRLSIRCIRSMASSD